MKERVDGLIGNYWETEEGKLVKRRFVIIIIIGIIILFITISGAYSVILN